MDRRVASPSFANDAAYRRAAGCFNGLTRPRSCGHSRSGAAFALTSARLSAPPRGRPLSARGRGAAAHGVAGRNDKTGSAWRSAIAPGSGRRSRRRRPRSLRRLSREQPDCPPAPGARPKGVVAIGAPARMAALGPKAQGRRLLRRGREAGRKRSTTNSAAGRRRTPWVAVPARTPRGVRRQPKDQRREGVTCHGFIATAETRKGITTRSVRRGRVAAWNRAEGECSRSRR